MPDPRSLPQQSDQVWTMTESRVYHLTRDCPALNRRDRYYSPRLIPLATATGSQPYTGQRRPCSLCAAPKTGKESSHG